MNCLSIEDKNKAMQVFPELDLNDMGFTTETLIASKTRKGAYITLDYILDFIKGPFTLVDLFGGSGSISLSAALRKLKTVYNELNIHHFNLALSNLEKCNRNVSNEIIFRKGNALDILAELNIQGNHPVYGRVVLYMDPPWRESYYTKGEDFNSVHAKEDNALSLSSIAEESIRICIGKEAAFFITLPLEMKFFRIEPDVVFASYGRDGIINGKTFGFGLKSLTRRKNKNIIKKPGKL